MGLRTPLYASHLAAGAKMVDFGGWDMPLHYGSQIEEHHQVRRDAGMFDVSHMAVVDLTGKQVVEFLQRLLANDVARLTSNGKALYSAMLNDSGGVLDDLLVYRIDDSYRLVLNAANRVANVARISRQAASFAVTLNVRKDLAIIAVQGPRARDVCVRVMNSRCAALIPPLEPFHGVSAGDWFIARTGYTGEDGLEIMLPAAAAPELWASLLTNGVKPCGLGARDTLRLEAGLNLYGTDMDEHTSPLAASMGWTIAWEPENRHFIGRAALEAQRQLGKQSRQVGLVLRERGILRSGQPVMQDGQRIGTITSGTFSPTLGCSIALARIEPSTGPKAQVDIRGKLVEVQIVRPGFVRHGEAIID